MEERKKDLETLGSVHTGPTSAFTGMRRCRSLIRQYPRHYLKFQDEKKREETTERLPGDQIGGL